MKEKICMKNSEFSEARSGNDNRFGERIPNRYVVIKPENSQVYTQLASAAGLNVQLGAHVCFNTNKLDYAQFGNLMDTIPESQSKRWALKNKKFGKTVNWVSATAFTQAGKTPCDPLKESIDLYTGLEIDQEGKRITSYGSAELKIDFSKLPLALFDDGFPAYPFGCFFFSDLANGYDDYSAAISCLPDRIRDVSHYKYIKAFPFDSNEPVSCQGKFRQSGNFILFYAANAIEKEEGIFYPDVTIVNITVCCFREKVPPYIVKETAVCNIRKMSSCVKDVTDFISGDIFSFYEVKDHQFCGEICHAFGSDPIEYNFPPSIGDERSRFYGGNHAHMASKGHNARHEKSYGYKPNRNLWSYLQEINSKNEANILISAKENPEGEEGEKEITESASKEKAGKKGSKGKKEKAGKKGEAVEIQYTDTEINATFEAAEPGNGTSLENEEITPVDGSGCSGGSCEVKAAEGEGLEESGGDSEEGENENGDEMGPIPEGDCEAPVEKEAQEDGEFPQSVDNKENEEGEENGQREESAS
jgi:hypothetical protein